MESSHGRIAPLTLLASLASLSPQAGRGTVSREGPSKKSSHVASRPSPCALGEGLVACEGTGRMPWGPTREWRPYSLRGTAIAAAFAGRFLCEMV